ncbi:MAG TPA: hypothetical protein VHW64_18700 [Nocardioides sp.]|jgi:hypothetical protein|uniref:hypothetical protein n=1 Tax=Nocardioides sp. TaxID=35761 RepID=UPI002E31C856|nr:hypothetical protein [Nocardioides sp.]HEX3932733.1 hypothetical protein [Nocardioides sp.]
MRSTRLGAALASLTITAGTATLLMAGPAMADTDTGTQAGLVLGGRTGTAVAYGDYLGTFDAAVSDGTNPVTVGAADLQQQLPGKTWKVVKSDADVSDGISFGSFGSKARGNVKYRLHYLGGTDTDTATTYAASYSNTVIVKTAWNLSPHALCTTKCRFYGKLSPKAKHRKVLIQVKHHGWKRYKVLHTNAHSHWNVVVKPSRGNGTYYRAVVAKTKQLIKSYAVGRFTIVGRSALGINHP